MQYKIYDRLPMEACDIRNTVFVDEQGFNEEFDSTDHYSKHIVIFCDGKAVATGRYFTEDGDEYHIGRVAVLKEYRKHGYGKRIMDIIECDIKENTDAKRIVLSAQVRAKSFYTKCGFTETGSIYLDEDCEHIMMFKTI